MKSFFENNLEEIIFNNKNKIHTRGFSATFYKNTETQFVLPSGKIIDILSWEISNNNELSATIFELKRNNISIESLSQVCEYALEFLVHVENGFKYLKLEIVLCGCTISEQILNLVSLNSNLSVYTYDYTYDGIFFKKEVGSYEITNINEQNKSNIEDLKDSGLVLKLRRIQNEK